MKCEGVVFETNNCGKAVIVSVVNTEQVIVKFLDTGFMKKVHYSALKNGGVKDPMCRSIYGIGYPGDGEFKTRTNGELNRDYSVWRGIFDRCYMEPRPLKFASYSECTVHPEWHNMQNFCNWYRDNYIEDYELDKDIISQGNKVYGPDTCIFVHPLVNSFFSNSRVSRGDSLIGSSFNHTLGKYESYCSDTFTGKKVNLGLFDSQVDANKEWVKYKKRLCKKLIDEGYVHSEELRDMLINYEWEKLL